MNVKRDIKLATAILGRNRGGLHTDRQLMLSEFPELFTEELNAVLPSIAVDLVIEKTWTEVAQLKATNTLVKGSIYCITDRYNYQSGGTANIPNLTFTGDDRGLVYVQALETNVLSKEAIRIMACPESYSGGIGTDPSIGVWHITKNITGSLLTIWGGKVWQNISGLIGTSIGETALSADWVLQTKVINTKNRYIDKQFSVLYDFDNDWFEKQWDGKGNKVGVNYDSAVNWYSLFINPCDISDWNLNFESAFICLDNNLLLGFFNNTCVEFIGNTCLQGAINSNRSNTINNNTVTYGIIDNNIENINNNITSRISSNTSIYDYSSITDNQIMYNIDSNTSLEITNNKGAEISNNASSIVNNTNFLSISSNICNDISYNTCTYITGNLNSGSIRNNLFNNIQNNDNTVQNIIGNTNIVLANLNSGDIEYNTKPVTGLATSFTKCSYDQIYNDPSGYILNITGVSTIIVRQPCKEVILTSANASESLTSVNTSVPNIAIKLFPESGLVVTINHGVAINQIKCEGGINAVIDGTNGDWIELNSRVNGFLYQQNIGTY